MRILKVLTKRWELCFLASAIPFLLIAGTAEAAVKTIWPDKFIPALNNQNSINGPGWAASGLPTGPGSLVVFYTSVKLPVGAEITDLRHFHRGRGLNPATAVTLTRVKMGKKPNHIIKSESTDDTDTIIATGGTFFPGVDHFVRRGFRYYVKIRSDNNKSAVWGIKIFYR